MMGDLIDNSTLLSRSETRDAGQRLASIIDGYIGEVQQALLKAPLIPTEAAVQEWSLRLDELVDQKRWSEVVTLHDWLNVAFGRERSDNPRPLDLRLHRRLGELYMRAKKWVEAAREFTLARSLSPRDILILRLLGRAYIEQKDFTSAKKIIDEIKALDEKAFVRNAECAALLGRLYSDQGNYDLARQCLEQAFAENADSYYLAELIAQAELELGHVDTAKARYKQVVEILKRLGERNIWVRAAELNEAVISNQSEDMIQEKIAKICEFNPTLDNLASIESGLRRIQKAVAIDNAKLADWMTRMRP
jgi:tetratricopeptide (TPR) repeat protein